jgi:hypothetical protein
MDDFYLIKKTDTHVHLCSLNSELIDLAMEDNFQILYINTDAPGLPSLEKQFEYASTQHNEFNNKVDFITAFSLVNWDSPNWADK